MEQKRKRGRPKGSQINDSRYLDQVADLMLKEPALKKTPAIARIVAKQFPEHQHVKMNRRLLRKWNETHEARMHAAKERRNELRRERSVGKDVRHAGSAYASLGLINPISEVEALMAKQVQDLVNQPVVQWIEEQKRMEQKIRDMIDPPFVHLWREQEEIMKRLFNGF